MVGSNRIITASRIVNPLGNAELEAGSEKALRRTIIEKALEALQTEIKEQTVYARPS